MTRGNISAEDAYVQTANPKSQNHSLLDFLAYGDNQRSNFRGMEGGVRAITDIWPPLYVENTGRRVRTGWDGPAA